MPFIQDSHLPLSSFVKMQHPYDLDSSSTNTTMNGHLANGEFHHDIQTEDSPVSVSLALALAREAQYDFLDPSYVEILERAIARIWTKIQIQPDTYVMTREEFGVFNYFQHRFQGDHTAVAARARYWDSNHS